MERRVLRIVGLGLIAFLAGCSSHLAENVGDDDAALAEEDLVPEPDDELARTPWQVLGTGVAYKPVVGGGDGVLLAYGGYSALDEYSQRWGSELVRAAGEWPSMRIGHLYAIRGPNDPGYANREIQNSRLALHLAREGLAERATRLVIVSHSSGTFVSSELLTMMTNGAHGVPEGTLEKVDLFELDGGGLPSASVVRRLSHAYFVLACDGAIARCSHNAEGMRSLGRTWASMGGAIEVDATGSGCSRTSSGGLWCLHDTVITTRPHNPNHYDLRRDYTDFTGGREVVTAYLR